jgi:hypothetical protein
VELETSNLFLKVRTWVRMCLSAKKNKDKEIAAEVEQVKRDASDNVEAYEGWVKGDGPLQREKRVANIMLIPFGLKSDSR